MSEEPATPEMMETVDQVADVLTSAARVLFITGAGISADSGLPTYRGVGGLYEDAEVEDGHSIEELLSGPLFARDPGLTWKYIRQIESACRGAEPNAGHLAIADIESRIPGTWVLTQNVDGLHRGAGSKNTIEIHGNVHSLSCTGCSWTERVEDYAELELLPRCPVCEAVVRPDVVLFGEMLPAVAVRDLERELDAGFDLVVSVGTSSLFPYIAQPVLFARARGVPTLEINPGDTSISGLVRHRLRLGAARALGLVHASFLTRLHDARD